MYYIERTDNWGDVVNRSEYPTEQAAFLGWLRTVEVASDRGGNVLCDSDGYPVDTHLAVSLDAFTDGSDEYRRGEA